MNTLIKAIEQFEVALAFADDERVDVAAAEAELREELCKLGADDHDDVCVHEARGCCEGVQYRGTVYAPGWDAEGDPCVMVMRRLTWAADQKPAAAILGF